MKEESGNKFLGSAKLRVNERPLTTDSGGGPHPRTSKDYRSEGEEGKKPISILIESDGGGVILEIRLATTAAAKRDTYSVLEQWR